MEATSYSDAKGTETHTYARYSIGISVFEMVIFGVRGGGVRVLISALESRHKGAGRSPTPTPKIGIEVSQASRLVCVCLGVGVGSPYHGGSPNVAWRAFRVCVGRGRQGYGGPTPTPKFGMRPRRPGVRCVFGCGGGTHIHYTGEVACGRYLMTSVERLPHTHTKV